METVRSAAISVYETIANFYESQTLHSLVLALPPGALTETTFNRFLSHSNFKTGTSGFAIVSADRTDRVDFANPMNPTTAEVNAANAANNKHRRELENLLHSLGLTYSRVRGGWYDKDRKIFSTENSYYVYDVDEKTASKIGHALTAQPFNQDAILYGVPGRGVFLMFKGGDIQRIGSSATPGIVDQGYTQMRKSSTRLSDVPGKTAPVPGQARVFSFESADFVGFLPNIGSLAGLHAFNEALKAAASR